MKSLASLVLIFATPLVAQEPPAGDGPRGSSQVSAGETRVDVVGRADVAQMPGMFVVARGLPAGGYAEVTSLANGRTIVATVADGDVAPGLVAMLSADAATALGGDAAAGVRVRRVVPLPQDIASLRAGLAGESRPDAPPALLAALRRKLAPLPVSTPTPVAHTKPTAAVRKASTATVATATAAKPAPRPTAVTPAAAKPVAAVTAGFSVQVAAVSNAQRARALAQTLGATVVAGPPVWRVRLGPYPTLAAAERAKADAARRGHPGATIVRIP